MSAKIEIVTIWIMSIIGLLAKHDLLFFVSISVQIIIGIRNFPGACQNLKNLKDRIYARMVKKTHKD
jgi:hypothetical protein